MKIIQAMVVSFAASFGVSASDANDWEALMPECFAIMEAHDHERDAYIATKLEEFPCNPQSLGEFLARIVCAKAADRTLIEDSCFTRRLTAAESTQFFDYVKSVVEGLESNPATNELEVEDAEKEIESAVTGLNFVDAGKFSDESMNLRQEDIRFLSRQIYACIPEDKVQQFIEWQEAYCSLVPEAVSVSLDSAYDDADSTGGASSH